VAVEDLGSFKESANKPFHADEADEMQWAFTGSVPFSRSRRSRTLRRRGPAAFWETPEDGARGCCTFAQWNQNPRLKPVCAGHRRLQRKTVAKLLRKFVLNFVPFLYQNRYRSMSFQQIVEKARNPSATMT
jgi:hypothetical protein